MSTATRQSYLDQDAVRKEIERSKESNEETDLCNLVDATRKFDKRAMETEREHKARIFKQQTRQIKLRADETLEKRIMRQESDAARKVLRTKAKADAYESSYDPKKDWNSRLDKDMLRHQNSRAVESEEKMKVRKEKNIDYHRMKRALLTVQERKKINQDKVEYTRWKREEDKRQNAEK